MAVDVDPARELTTNSDDPHDRDTFAAAESEDGPATRTEAEKPAASAAVPAAAHDRHLLVAGVLIVVVLAGLVVWLGYRGYVVHQEQKRHELFLETARQSALNLTTISYTEVDADVQRILDSATGTFFDDFQKRFQPFADVVRQAQSSSVGDITAAGVEMATKDSAQVLVVVTVKTSSPAGADQQPRSWRMRIAVERVDDAVAKVSNVEFVP